MRYFLYDVWARMHPEVSNSIILFIEGRRFEHRVLLSIAALMGLSFILLVYKNRKKFILLSSRLR